MKNASLYRKLHAEDADYGASGQRYLRVLCALAQDIAARSVLDYGCGKSALSSRSAEALGIEACGYDPFIPELSDPPDRPFDLVVNTDVLEHVPESELDSVLERIGTVARHGAFVISTRYATALLDNGETRTCTVRCGAAIGGPIGCNVIFRMQPNSPRPATMSVS